MTNEEAREFVRRWQKAGPALEKNRRKELRAFSHLEEAERIDGLIADGLRHALPSNTSGLLEMQRIFARARS